MRKLLHPRALKEDLDQLITDAASTQPNLSLRLTDLRRWISKKNDGLLMSKKLVIDFLMEIIVDAKFWLTFQNATSQQQQEILGELSPVERYWYIELFSTWLEESDPKLTLWKQKLMSGEFSQNDSSLIGRLIEEIEDLGGHALWKYILDLSMATDLVASGRTGIPLCVQLTTVAEDLSADKKDQWILTLRYWGITRALFLSFNPQGEGKNVANLATLVLQKGDDLPQNNYCECSLE